MSSDILSPSVLKPEGQSIKEALENKVGDAVQLVIGKELKMGTHLSTNFIVHGEGSALKEKWQLENTTMEVADKQGNPGRCSRERFSDRPACS